MATGPGKMAPVRLVWLQCPTTWQQGGWDGNRARPHGTREAGMATGPGHMAGPLLWLQCPARWHKGGWDGNRTWAQATREAEMATGSGQIAPWRLVWQQGLATWHQGG